MRWCLPSVGCGPIHGAASTNCHQNTPPPPNYWSRALVCVRVRPAPYAFCSSTADPVTWQLPNTPVRQRTRVAVTCSVQCAVQPTHFQQSVSPSLPACLHTLSVTYRNGSESFWRAVGQFVRRAAPRRAFCTCGALRTGK
jgi:hypothetical protein